MRRDLEVPAGRPVALRTPAVIALLTILRADLLPGGHALGDQTALSTTRDRHAAGDQLAIDAAPATDEPAGARQLQLRVLGALTVLRPHPDGSASPVHLRRAASRELLLYLAVHRDGATPSELKEALWPDVANSAATRRLATSLSELRQVLQQAAGAAVVHRTAADPPSSGPAGADAYRYELDPSLVQVDLWQLGNLIRAAARAADPTTRSTLLHEAAALDRGNLGQGITGEWLDPARERVALQLVDLHVHLADADPDHQAAIRRLHRAADLAPHNETIYQAAMRRHAAAGDPDGVRRALTTAFERLAEIGAAPTAATRDLATDLSVPTTATAHRAATSQPTASRATGLPPDQWRTS